MAESIAQGANFRHLTFPATASPRRRAVDFAMPPELHSGASAERGLPADQAAFVRWLFEKAGVNDRDYRTETSERRLPACLRTLRVSSVRQAWQLLEANPSRIHEALSAMLVGVSSFFRDPSVFESLAGLMQEMMQGRDGIYIWSAGCSDGAELYTMAILLAEQGNLARSYLLGTDCRPDAIQRARRGIYEPACCKLLPTAWRSRYFKDRKSLLQVDAPLKAPTRWRTADLLQTQEPGIWDIIFCRNTTMYFKSEATLPLWRKLEASLRPGGILVLGKAERPSGVKRLAPIGPCLYRRTRG